VILVAGLGQVVGLGVFFYNLLPRIRSTCKADWEAAPPPAMKPGPRLERG